MTFNAFKGMKLENQLQPAGLSERAQMRQKIAVDLIAAPPAVLIGFGEKNQPRSRAASRTRQRQRLRRGRLRDGYLLLGEMADAPQVIPFHFTLDQEKVGMVHLERHRVIQSTVMRGQGGKPAFLGHDERKA